MISKTLFRSTPQSKALKKYICFNSKHIGKIYGQDPVTTLSSVGTILQEETDVGESLYLLNHVKSSIMTTHVNDFHVLNQGYLELRQDHVIPKLTPEAVAGLNSEELYAAINNLYAEDDVSIASACLGRFYELI
jgi:hypothetical protein